LRKKLGVLELLVNFGCSIHFILELQTCKMGKLQGTIIPHQTRFRFHIEYERLVNEHQTYPLHLDVTF
jgi:hypothetical protein